MFRGWWTYDQEASQKLVVLVRHCVILLVSGNWTRPYSCTDKSNQGDGQKYQQKVYTSRNDTGNHCGCELGV